MVTNVQLTLLSYITMEIAVYPLVNIYITDGKITTFNG